MENSGAADERIGPGMGAFRSGNETDAAIDGNPVVQLLIFPPGARLLDFGKRFVDELLAAESGVYSHYQEGVDLIEERLDESERRSAD